MLRQSLKQILQSNQMIIIAVMLSEKFNASRKMDALNFLYPCLRAA
jgi:hypothetical protein